MTEFLSSLFGGGRRQQTSGASSEDEFIPTSIRAPASFSYEIDTGSEEEQEQEDDSSPHVAVFIEPTTTDRRDDARSQLYDLGKRIETNTQQLPQQRRRSARQRQKATVVSPAPPQQQKQAENPARPLIRAPPVVLEAASAKIGANGEGSGVAVELVDQQQSQTSATTTDTDQFKTPGSRRQETPLPPRTVTPTRRQREDIEQDLFSGDEGGGGYGKNETPEGSEDESRTIIDSFRPEQLFKTPLPNRRSRPSSVSTDRSGGAAAVPVEVELRDENHYYRKKKLKYAAKKAFRTPAAAQPTTAAPSSQSVLSGIVDRVHLQVSEPPFEELLRATLRQDEEFCEQLTSFARLTVGAVHRKGTVFWREEKHKDATEALVQKGLSQLLAEAESSSSSSSYAQQQPAPPRPLSRDKLPFTISQLGSYLSWRLRSLIAETLDDASYFTLENSVALTSVLRQLLDAALTDTLSHMNHESKERRALLIDPSTRNELIHKVLVSTQSMVNSIRRAANGSNFGKALALVLSNEVSSQLYSDNVLKISSTDPLRRLPGEFSRTVHDLLTIDQYQLQQRLYVAVFGRGSSSSTHLLHQENDDQRRDRIIESLVSEEFLHSMEEGRRRTSCTLPLSHLVVHHRYTYSALVAEIYADTALTRSQLSSTSNKRLSSQRLGVLIDQGRAEFGNAYSYRRTPPSSYLLLDPSASAEESLLMKRPRRFNEPFNTVIQYNN